MLDLQRGAGMTPYSRRAESYTTFSSTEEGPQLYDRYAGEESEESAEWGAGRRPESNLGVNAFNAMGHGGQAQQMRQKLTGFGSPWGGLEKFFIPKTLKAITELFPMKTDEVVVKELRGLFRKDISKFSREEFLALRTDPSVRRTPGTWSAMLPDRGPSSDLFTPSSARAIADEIAEAGGAEARRPGLQHALRATDSGYAEVALVLRGSKGQPLVVGTNYSMAGKGGSRQTSRGLLWANTADPEHSRSMTNLVSHRMFQLGGVRTDSLSDAGAKAYLRVAQELQANARPAVEQMTDFATAAMAASKQRTLGKTLYISGPMSDLEGMNYAAFGRAERAILATGALPINPAHNRVATEILQGRNPKRIWGAFLRESRTQVSRADAVVVLGKGDYGSLAEPQLSRGVLQEVQWAMNQGKPVLASSARARSQIDAVQAMARTANVQSRTTVPGLSATVKLNRGSRETPRGGNG